MINVSVARRYARALISVAGDSGGIDTVLEPLDAFARALESEPELTDLLVNPAYSRLQRAAVVEAMLKHLGAKEPAFVNLIKLLCDRGRLVHLPQIARLYRDLADERAGRVRGKVTTAVELSKESLAKLGKTLEKATQRSVVLETRVDPTILGGASAQVGSMVYDGTLRTQLEDLRRQLKRG